MARPRSPYVRKANSLQQRERSRSPRRRSSRSPERRRRSYSRSRSRSRDNYRRSDRRSRSPGGREGGRDSGRYERGFNSSSAAPARGSEDRVQAKEQMMAGVRDASQQDRRVYVGNLSYDVKWHHLKDFMRQGEFEVLESFPQEALTNCVQPAKSYSRMSYCFQMECRRWACLCEIDCFGVLPPLLSRINWTFGLTDWAFACGSCRDAGKQNIARYRTQDRH